MQPERIRHSREVMAKLKNFKYILIIPLLYSCATSSPMFVVDPNSVENEEIIDRFAFLVAQAESNLHLQFHLKVLLVELYGENLLIKKRNSEITSCRMYGEKRIYDIFFRIVISNTIGYR